MRYLEIPPLPGTGLGTTRRISAIGLGTWQFGSREWGYGLAYAEREAGQIVRRALQAVGLVDQVGVSNYPVERWRAAETALGSPVLSDQVQYSLVHPQPAADLVPYALREGRVVIAYSPLAQGLLSGRYDEAHRP